MTNTIICKICGITFTTTKRSDTKYCDKCRTNRPWYTWGNTEHGKDMRSKRHKELRQIAFDGYGGKCTCCGESTFEFLALDHVGGGGNRDRKIRSTRQIADYVIKNNFPKDFTVLCHNCNLAKGFFGECPHQKNHIGDKDG